MPVQKTSPKSKAPTKAPLKAVKSPAKKVGSSPSAKAEDGVPLSTIIRRRIQAKKARFHANDNIAQFIQPGDLEGLVDEVANDHGSGGNISGLAIKPSDVPIGQAN